MINTSKVQLLRDQCEIRNRSWKAAVKKKKRLIENEIIQQEEDFRSNHSNNLFETVFVILEKVKEKSCDYEG